MSSIFKALASTTAWILFIGGLITLANVLIMTALSGQLYAVDSPPPMQFFVGLGIATFTSASAVVCMKLRQLLE